MKEQQIQGIISGIRDEFILEAEPKALAALLPETDPVAGTVILSSPAEGSRRKTRGKAKRWIPLIVAAAVTLTVGLNLGLYAGMNALLAQGGALLPSTPSGGNPLGGLLGGLFPFLQPEETEPPYEVTVRDPEDITEPPDTRTECEKGNHQWEITDYEQATCYLVSPVTHTCSLCGETKRESDYRPHAYEDGICTVCGMPEGAWTDVEYILDSTDPDYLCISKVNGDPEGKLILPVHFYDPSMDRFIPVTEIGKSALAKLDKITEVVIPNTVTRIGNNAFVQCTALERVNFPDGLTSIDYNAFNRCSSLKEAHLPDSVTELGGNVFMNCTALVSATLPPSFDTIPGGIYGNCRSLTDVTLKGTIKTVGEAAFMGCSSLKQIPDMPELEVIGNNAFENCDSLTEVTLPATLRELGHKAFLSCSSLKKVTIEASSMYGIYTRVFWGCTALQEITLPSIVGVFSGDEMFSQCNALTIYCMGTQEEWQRFYLQRHLKIPAGSTVIFSKEDTESP